MKHKIFIDGQYGTTGLKIDEMLHGRQELEILTIQEKDKKDPGIKRQFFNDADLVFLCLPDDASRESMQSIDTGRTKVIDASTAHRTDNEWTYGIPELNKDQREKIKESCRVCVPGCHATGFIMAVNPLIQNQIVSRQQKIVCHSITGFSGGGRQMIETYENPDNLDVVGSQRPYALTLNHKHLPEIQHVLGLETPPLFTPSVGHFKQGMLVMSYLVRSELLDDISRTKMVQLYQRYYQDEAFIRIVEDNDNYLDSGFLSATACQNTNRMEISVYENDHYLLLISRLDNLGKGASGAAVQNMNLMMGLDETTGLSL